MLFRSTGNGAIALFSGQGELIWQRTLEDRYRFGDTDYSPMWYPTDLMPFRVDGQWRIAASWHHHTWWPGVVTSYDRDGRLMEQFVNAGWIHQMNTSADGRYLLAAGVSNALGGTVLAVLDTRAIKGASPSEGSVLPVCANCPSGAPVAYFLVPWRKRPMGGDTVVTDV